jgi:antitoxin ParD1/3/4
MRTSIEIDDGLKSRAMRAGPFKTKKDAVEAGLKLLARQAAYREILKWEGKLGWEGDESVDWTRPPEPDQVLQRSSALTVAEPSPRHRLEAGTEKGTKRGTKPSASPATKPASRGRARAGR